MSPSSSDLSAPIAEALERVEPGLEQVERAMKDQLASQSEAVALVGDHVLSSGGKRIRPALLFFAAEMCGYDGPRQVQIAASVELLHTATLLHDDVVDLSDLRRGRPAAHAVFGNRRAVLVGDYLYARASSMIVEDGDPEIQLLFSDTIRRMAEGELLQLARGFDPEITETLYFDVIERKSAALLSAAAEAGAILGAVTRAERRRLSEYGRQIGLAFQLRDDALDYSGVEDELGKRPFDDLREGKVTLPLLLTLKRATPAEVSRNTTSLIVLGPLRMSVSMPSSCSLTTEALSKAIIPRIPPVPKRSCWRKALTRSSHCSCSMARRMPCFNLLEMLSISGSSSHFLKLADVFRRALSYACWSTLPESLASCRYVAIPASA